MQYQHTSKWCALIALAWFYASAAQADTKMQAAVALSKEAERKALTLNRRYEAVKLIDQAISLAPGVSDFYYKKATYLYRQEEDDQALDCINQSIALNPNYDRAWETKASILTALRRPEEALKAVDKAIKLKDSNLNRLTRAEVLTNLHKLAQAEGELDILVKREPQNPQIRGRRATVGLHLGHWAVAAEDLTYAIDSADKNTMSYVARMQERARAYRMLKLYDKSAADLKACIKYHPDRRELHQELQEIYTLSGKKDLAQVESNLIDALDHDFKPFK